MCESCGWVPPGWPEEVCAPSRPEWQATAVELLFDCCPADLRASRLLRRQPTVLAAFAVRHLDAQLQASSQGRAELRVELNSLVGPHVVSEALDVWEAVHARLIRRRREVGLVAAGLRGEVFRPRL